jgi:uncharacterized protein YegP (UPF0339 family)
MAAIVTLLPACDRGQPAARPSAAAPRQDRGLPADATLLRTAHFTIHSTATAEQTTRVAAAAEALEAAYAARFGATPPGKRFELVLYADRDQFKRDNHSRPWAEAYYLAPRCYAYYSDDANPYHWMLHEATHQLLRESSGYRPAKWINEGIASYFGASRLENGVLREGTIDADAYPIWWLPAWTLTGDLHADIAAGRIIPLRQLIEDTGPPIDQNVNLYYLHYWSLSHFLLQYDHGRYAAGYTALVARGGSLADFEALVGPVERIEAQWYGYVRQVTSAAAAPAAR